MIDWLEAAELVLKLPIVGAFEQPLNAYTKESLFKLMIFDVGLLGAMNRIQSRTILDYDYGTYKGYFAENFVAQQLIAQTPKQLFSWQENRSELEFFLPHQGEVIPIEVKSGKVTRAKSLEQYYDKYHSKKSVILAARVPHINRNKTIYHLPLYLAERLSSLFSEQKTAEAF